jgi:D-aminoacyl-tRNA deacylase
MVSPCLIVVSDSDPVAREVLPLWGAPEATDWKVEGTPIRRLGPATYLLRRPGMHIHDERLDRRLPPALAQEVPTMVFPSIHRSERNVECLTVHPLGNPGPLAEVGGRPRTLVPTDPRRMADGLRRLAEGGRSIGLPATFEATHHGPALGLPSFFVEIGFGAAARAPEPAVRLLADVIPRISVDPNDRVALAVGGGHYAPHFTDLALRRRWAFGHILGRYALPSLDRATARAACEGTPGAEGIVFARSEDQSLPALDGLGPRLRDQDAPAGVRVATTASSRSASGT